MPDTIPYEGQSSAVQLWERWPELAPEERVTGFRELPAAVVEDFFLSLDAREQLELLLSLSEREKSTWIRLLPPDDAADLIQAAREEQRLELLDRLDITTRREVRALLAYAEDVAGGLMNPRFARVRPDMMVEEAIRYLRRQAQYVETIYYAYVLDAEQRLLGVLSFRQLFQAPDDRPVTELMNTDVVAVREETDQEEVGRLYMQYDLLAIPVVDEEGRMKGIVTFDDISEALSEEDTEDIQKIGGSGALDVPYLEAGIGRTLRSRAGWLSVLFLGEMLTASAMGYFQDELSQALVLALFIPLIISSGGNSGSQATTLVIRAMALGQVRLRDWWRVFGREIASGLLMGMLLGVIGAFRVVAWQRAGFYDYGDHYALVAITVGIALIGVVTFGTLVGSMLPFVFRRLGFDPASASAPFVATLVDVMGVVLYFGVASLLLHGRLLP